MSAQLAYNFSTPLDVAGGIYDLAPYAIDTFLNEEDTGTMLFGIAVVQGTKPGINVKVPTSSATAATIEGITTNNRTTEYDLEGKIHVKHGAAIGVMRYGRIYARIATGATPSYGDAVYVIPGGDEAGFVTDAADNGESGADKVSYVAIKARFLGKNDSTNQIALVELFNEAQ